MKQHPLYSHLFISVEGEVFSTKTNKFLKLQTNKKGYKVFSTRLNGRKSPAICLRVHRLVAETYIPNVDRKSAVNHIDGNKTNNCVENLEWCTNQENSQHAVDLGLIHNPTRENHHFYKGSVDRLRQVLVLRAQGISLRSIADHFKVSHVTIINWIRLANVDGEDAGTQTQDLSD